MTGYVTDCRAFSLARAGGRGIVWPFVAGRSTTATLVLERAKIPFTLHEYEHDPRAGSYGLEASDALGVPPDRVFKTLVAAVDGGSLAVGVIPVHRYLDLKGLAAAVGGKKAVLAEVAAAERATGYVTGGISPVGQKKRLPVVIDETALDCGTLFCSAGRRGLEIEIAPADLVSVTGAGVAPIAVITLPASRLAARCGRPAALAAACRMRAGGRCGQAVGAGELPGTQSSERLAVTPASSVTASCPADAGSGWSVSASSGDAGSAGSGATAAAASGLTSSAAPGGSTV
jgi:Cys-tRNA(Pro)/Cys-tRNA(Cys) deacylase